MPKQKKMFILERNCVACGRGFAAKDAQQKLRIFGLYPLLYRSGEKKNRKLMNCGRINICEECLTLFISGATSSKVRPIVTALRERLAHGYNAKLADGEK
jgi:hypothetical protein